MENKHTIKYFFCDEGGVLNADGYTNVFRNDKEISNAIGKDIMAECNQITEHGEASYGCIIEYTIKPITKDPYK